MNRLRTETKAYCNNCDKYGHNFHNCRKPFESSGIVAFRKNDDGRYEYLMVCRKHSFGYIDFLRGRYSVNNKSQIIDIIFEMSNHEKDSIRNKTFEDLWLELWGSVKNSYYTNERIFAKEKFQMLMRGITIKNIFYNTISLLDECTINWVSPEWGFPKGRKNHREENKVCAIREWCEETGYKKENIDIIDNLEPYEEFVIGSNYQSYKDRYYLGMFNNINNENNSCKSEIKYQKMEISDAKWVTIEEMYTLIRPYHLERLKIISKIDKLLNKYSLYIYG
jgi:8-oxo-dGTP pyrophosphatase MutT (NUDIX family)